MYISKIDREYMRSLDERKEIRQTATDIEIAPEKRRENKGNIEVIKDIRSLTLQNNEFKRIIIDKSNLELSIMSIPVGGETEIEIHNNSDQFLFIELSYGKVIDYDKDKNVINERDIAPGDGVFIEEGTYHNVVNLGSYPMKLVSFYAPRVEG